MKFSASVTFDMETIDLIDEYMRKNPKMKKFSQAICAIVKEHKRFKSIALKLQKKGQ